MRVEWIAVVVAVIAALAAVWQAWEARRARRLAQAAADEAKQHEARAVTAAERTAQALEEQTAMIRAERERYESPWRITREKHDWGVKGEFRLGGNETLDRVVLKTDEANAQELDVRGLPVAGPMRPGQAISVLWGQTYDSPLNLDVTIEWTRPNGETLDEVITLP
ncbi:hypothetical protein [Microbacterium allomyrinae]|uniref:Uncharacterized protein n=1 Tax=Microbacterium allomyrinae TaxID=2830666 RepID=A0A9X1LSH4_9MICO|nr:hypothetical protein [Microbacterium allomyrinae]MCC2030906.1 hypothetical protein [Microbacterium allomyrinae]